ncbi:MAG: TrmH family RNA methyltransferase [Oscillospiraceae bacterium]|nr:TrmH family RNA methyltransferase [Oscillospiraceae bacterium]
MEHKLKTYKKGEEFDYSYALGASPTIELLKNRPEDCFQVIFSPSYDDKDDKIKKLCGKYKIPCEENQKIINILSPKENCYAIGAFKKRSQTVDKNKSHVVLDNPSDMGNLGTIMRSCAGFGIQDIAIIGNGADAYNPKTIRASMGAFFHVNVECFADIRDYLKVYGERETYTFMLNAEYNLAELQSADGVGVYSLIFGNEASGLNYDVYKNVGKSVVIKHSSNIDSLNLPIAVSIALFWFTK